MFRTPAPARSATGVHSASPRPPRVQHRSRPHQQAPVRRPGVVLRARKRPHQRRDLPRRHIELPDPPFVLGHLFQERDRVAARDLVQRAADVPRDDFGRAGAGVSELEGGRITKDEEREGARVRPGVVADGCHVRQDQSCIAPVQSEAPQSLRGIGLHLARPRSPRHRA